MAHVRPSLTELDQLLDPLDEGQLAVARALATLDDDWSVYIRPRVGQDAPDFVVAHDLAGVCAIEVRDWRRETHRRNEQGLVERRDNLGGWHPAADHPRFEAGRCRTTIYDQYFALPSDGTDTTEGVRAAVVLPQLTNVEAVELLSHPGVGERERKVAVWGGDGLSGQLDQIVRGNGCAHPRAESVQRLRHHLVVSEVGADPAPPARLSAGAAEIAQNPSGTLVRRVRGAAGSGKSFGLAARAARLAGEGKDVLVLSFNVTLANHLSTLVTTRCREYGANPTRVVCANFHSYCTRVVQDAELLGMELSTPRGRPWPEAIFAKADQAYVAGFERRFDAILVDEGQDFALDWWNLLRYHALRPGGEMLLAVDPTQDLYARHAWDDEERMRGAGFSGPWIELGGSYRMPNDVAPLVNAFAAAQLDGESLPAQVLADHDETVGARSGSTRHWQNVGRVGDIGVEVGREVVRLLREHPTLAPRDVAFLCEYHHDGVAAVAEIEAAGYPVHHIFSRDPDDARRRRKYRFWPDADAVKGCTVHNFKGWETTALVMGIGVEARSKRIAYVAMTRLKADVAGGGAYLSIVNADKSIADLQSAFQSWAPPHAALRFG